MIISIEPGIRKENQYGISLEDNLIVRKDKEYYFFRKSYCNPLL